MQSRSFILIVLLLCLAMVLKPVDAYVFTVYQMDNGTVSPFSTYSPSLYWPGTCTATIYAYNTGRDSDGSYSVLNQYFSPDMTERATSTNTYPVGANQTCKLQNTEMGLTFNTALNGMFEESTKTTHTASISADSYVKVVYNCTSINEYFRYYGGWLSDSYGNHPNAYMYSTSCCEAGTYGCGTGTKTLQYENLSVKNIIGKAYTCGGYLTPDDDVSVNCGAVSSGSWALSHWVIMPFSTGVSGKIDLNIYNVLTGINFSTAGINEISYQIYIIQKSNNLTYDLGFGSASTFTAMSWPNYTLEKDTDYTLAIGTMRWGQRTAGGTLTHNVYNSWSNYSLTIWDYRPAWNCTDWTECDNSINQRSRICTDLNGRVPINVETDECVKPTELYSRVLGFEDGITEKAWVCGADWLCYTNNTLIQIDVEYPVNWTITTTQRRTNIAMIAYLPQYGALENYVTLDSQLGTYPAGSGQKALKMWYIPPSMFEPVSANFGYPEDNVMCSNITTGRFPQLEHSYNNGSYVETNVSFPGDWPQISYWIKKCPENPIRYDTSQRGGIFAGGFVCNPAKTCYATNCNATVSGKYRMSLYGQYNVSANQSYDYTATVPVDDATFNLSQKDGNISYIVLWDHIETPYGVILNTPDMAFINGTTLTLFINKTVTPGDILITAGPDIYTVYYGSVSVTGDGFYNITLGNIPNETNLLYFNSGSGMDFYLDFLGITNPINRSLYSLSWEYFDDAPDQWTKRIIPLPSNIDSRGLYRLGISVNPVNVIDSSGHCVYFDQLEIGASATENNNVETCISDCIGKDYYDSKWTGTFCIRTITYNSLVCADPTLVTEIIKLINGEINHTCDPLTNTLITYNKLTKELVYSENSQFCIEEKAQKDADALITGTGDWLFDVFGISFGAYDFFFGTFMIGWYITLICSGLVSYYSTKAGQMINWQMGILTMAGFVIALSIGAIFPWYFGFGVILLAIIFFAYLWSKAGG